MAPVLYEKLGGQEAIATVVEEFYRRVLADDTISHFFTGTDMAKQHRHMTAFISFALGGPNQYSGRSMAKAHEGMNLQPAHLEAVAKHLGDALARFNVDPQDIEQVLSHVATLQDDVLYK